ncbi:hypothetical protein BHE74_00042238 [Ensete ventricosum]|nr:hypothetical protein GW17_00047272 [Ensete ventricosum]RWW51415.1 hypothetical protein BHE74_00042238 [Ensete ventricosum]
MWLGLLTNEENYVSENVGGNPKDSQLNAGVKTKDSTKVKTGSSSIDMNDPIQADFANYILKHKSVFKCRLCPRIVCLSEDTVKTHLKSKVSKLEYLLGVVQLLGAECCQKERFRTTATEPQKENGNVLFLSIARVSDLSASNRPNDLEGLCSMNQGNFVECFVFCRGCATRGKQKSEWISQRNEVKLRIEECGRLLVAGEGSCHFPRSELHRKPK